MPSPRLDEAKFKRRFLTQFVDPAFAPLEGELAKLTAAAWDAYENSRKSPHTRKAGPEFVNPDYDLAIDWINARDARRRRKTLAPAMTAQQPTPAAPEPPHAQASQCGSGASLAPGNSRRFASFGNAALMLELAARRLVGSSIGEVDGESLDHQAASENATGCS